MKAKSTLLDFFFLKSLWEAMLWLVVLTLFSTTDSWRMFQHGREKGGMLGGPHVDGDYILPPAQWFDQQLDHFDPTETTTWKQRYFTNDSFYSSGGPVFLMIGGEGTANPKWMVEGQWIEYAKQYGALCLQLEHRYYGKSHPTIDLSTNNLVYLSSQQALADLAAFIQAVNKERNLGMQTRWVAFGGSYPGSLAAWLRAKYPHLVHAAVSSSGPLLAKADFQTYYGVVLDALATTGPGCVKGVKDATRQMGLLMNHRIGQQHLKKLFKLCDPINPDVANDVSSLYETLAGNFAGVVQYNKDNRESAGSNITIDTVCALMVNSSLGPPVDRYARVNELLLAVSEQKCLDYSYNKMVDEMQSVKWSSEVAEGGRQWLYQTCTEFGFYQTSALEPHLFGNKFPLNFFIQQCSDIFGSRFNSSLLKRGIDRTNMFYGAYELQVSRVVFVQGSIDPWHALGITQSLSKEAPAIYIQGTAHCANMYPASDRDPPQLIKARSQIQQLLTRWLSH